MSDDKMPDWFKDICHECLMSTGKRLDQNQKHFLWTYISKPENLAKIPEVSDKTIKIALLERKLELCKKQRNKYINICSGGFIKNNTHFIDCDKELEEIK